MYVLITSNPDKKGGVEGVASLAGKYNLQLAGKARRSILGVNMTQEEMRAYNAIVNCINAVDIPADGCIGTAVNEELMRRWLPCMASFGYVGSVYLLSNDCENLILHSVWKK